MRSASVALVALLIAGSLSASTITSISPTSFHRNTGEEFLTVNGSSLGDTVRYDGPAGIFNVPVNFSNNLSTRVIAWVPLQVLNTPGTYSVTVTSRGGSSNAVSLTIGSLKFLQFALLVPELILLESRSREGMFIQYDVQPIGGEDPFPVVDCSPKSGSLFKMGVTNVQCVATNRYGDRATGTFAVNTYDGEPMWGAVEGAIVESGEDGATVDYKVSVADLLDGELKPQCLPASGSFFRLGKTNVRCTAADSGGNLADVTFPVEVKDISGVLKIHLPEKLVAEADSPEGGAVQWEAWASGSEDPELTIKCDPEQGSLFPFDFSSVTCIAYDRETSAEGRFEVEVIDSTPPAIELAVADPYWLAPDGEMVPVRLNVVPADLADPKPQCAVVDVTANEPISEKDWRILDESTVELRGAQNDKFTDRIYSVNLECVDVRQNRSATGISVVVSEEKPAQPLSGARQLK